MIVPASITSVSFSAVKVPEAGKICGVGTITEYRSSPEIVLRDAKSWYVPRYAETTEREDYLTEASFSIGNPIGSLTAAVTEIGVTDASFWRFKARIVTVIVPTTSVATTSAQRDCPVVGAHIFFVQSSRNLQSATLLAWVGNTEPPLQTR
jgi:hypothetical protein